MKFAEVETRRTPVEEQKLAMVLVVVKTLVPRGVEQRGSLV